MITPTILIAPDRTLFGLADKVRKEAGAAGASRPGQAEGKALILC